jgi:hypothetical protein
VRDVSDWAKLMACEARATVLDTLAHVRRQLGLGPPTLRPEDRAAVLRGEAFLVGGQLTRAFFVDGSRAFAARRCEGRWVGEWRSVAEPLVWPSGYYPGQRGETFAALMERAT